MRDTVELIKATDLRMSDLDRKSEEIRNTILNKIRAIERNVID